jgi:hypothetical protein
MLEYSAVTTPATDRTELWKHGLLLALLIVGWFALASFSHNLWFQIALGWIGFGGVALYFRWLLKRKVSKPPSETGEGQ